MTAPAPGLGARFLGTARQGALAGLVIGALLAVVVLAVDDSDVTVTVWGITMVLGAVFGAIALIRWLAAKSFTQISRAYVGQRDPLAHERMTLDRGLLWLGTAGVVSWLLVSAAALVLGETLF